MGTIDWLKEVNQRKEEFIADLKGLLQIKSVLDEENATKDAPLGKGVKEALMYMLDLGEKDGFEAKNIENIAGHLQFGTGAECVGILCHVDVVPEGDGWTSDPYSAEIRDGKIYARGALDDKGPTMAAYYAMKIVKELRLPLSKEIRMIIGTDEESQWRCVDTYFKNESMPTMGFAPDADFPIIYAEKGIADFDIVQIRDKLKPENEAMLSVISFSSGRRYNMVPDFATARLYAQNEQEVMQRFNEYLNKGSLTGRYIMDKGELILELDGVSAHGLEPDNGVNAGLKLAAFLAELKLDEKAAPFFTLLSDYFTEESRGGKLGVAYQDEITGDLTINVGKLHYTKDDGGRLGLTMRHPVTTDMEKTKSKLDELLESFGFSMENFSNSKPHYVEKDSELIQTLRKVYEEQTGEKAELISIGGGTYARSLEKGVAFGPLFPGREDIAHQKDEYMIIDDLVKATAIYAQAIYELAK
ncbi:dipeptidase PepV [Niallia sp. NCCP-28]|uniref:dipeptidase PepV n=1 Tax=Niallia sp. NCCP-28 TaxID=2934712 RepID=UPI002081A571|nr:dipeptidase PepV [Niallia sp. NCCP-28]GKU84828.1 dipeptidase PepV [Niallia sp. NCCP-28]